MSGTESDPIKLKILIIGSSFVGKSTLIVRFTKDKFTSDMKATIGLDFNCKTINLDGTHVSLNLWDTAGSEKYQSLTPNYYRNAHGIILVYDVTNQESFDSLYGWLEECDKFIDTEKSVKILVGNKIDLVENRVIDRNIGIKFARDNSMLFIESSAKTSEGVNLAFEELVMKILDNPSIWRQKELNLTEDLTTPNYGYRTCC